MTAQLAAALKRSIFPAFLAALAAAGTAAGQVQVGGWSNQVYFTIGLGGFVAGAIVLIRGVGEGLNDGQRAAIGKVLDSDVTTAAVSVGEAQLTPLIQKELAKAGIKVTAQQINTDVSNVEDFTKQVIEAKRSGVQPSGQATVEAPAAAPTASPADPTHTDAPAGMAPPTAS